MQRDEAIAVDAPRIHLVEDREAYAVEADQPVQRGEPEVPVGRLMNRADADDVLRQSNVRRPDVEAVLGQRGRRSEHEAEECQRRDDSGSSNEGD